MPHPAHDLRPSVRQLECIVALAETLHFRKAAAALGLAQPALSAHVAAVESLLGGQLFERDRRSVLLTPFGRDIVAQARRALAALDDIVAAAQRGTQPLAGRLALGVIPTVAPYWLPALLPTVRTAFPGLQLLLREEQTHRVLALLDTGELDCAIVALPVPGDLATLPLGEETFVLATPAQAPVGSAHLRTPRKGTQRKQRTSASTQSLTALADLDVDILLLDDGHCLRDQAFAVCATAGAHPSFSVRATSLPTLVQMVAGGLGATLLPVAAVPALVTSNTLIAITKFAAPAPSRTLGLIWRMSSARTKEFRMLGEALKAGTQAYLRQLG